MKTKFVLSLVAVAVGCAIAGSLETKGFALSSTIPGADSSNHIDVKSVVGNLNFLGTTPDLNGHPVLIEFWATWCPPCRASISHLNELNKKYHDKGLQIVGISGEDKDTVQNFRGKVAMDYNVALDKDQALASRFAIDAIPHAILLDKTGHVVWSGHPMELDEQIIAKAISPAASH